MIDVRYSVYDVKTDLPIAINATIPQCAKALNLTVGSFQSMASRQKYNRRRNGSQRKYRIVREGDETEDGEV